MTLAAIREQRASKVAEARTILNAAPGGTLTAEAQTAFDKIKATITDLEGQESRALFVEEAERRSLGEPIDKSRTDLESRVSLVEAINAHAEQRSLTGALAEYNAEQKRQGVQAKGVLVPQSLFNETRAAQTTTTATGIVPDDFRADQFVGLLRNAMVVRSLGARVLPNLRGDVVIPRQTSTSTAQWLNEGDALTDTGMTFDNIRMEPKHVGAITELSRQLLQQSNPSIEQLVKDDFQQVVGLAVDKALLHGTTVAKQPLGILNTVGIQTASFATLDWEAVLVAIEKLALENITPNAWITHPEVATILRSTLKSASAGAGYLMENGQLASLPVNVTKQLDKKTGAPATGRILLGDFSEMIIGTWGSVDVLTNQYAEGPFSRGAIQVRILTTLDMVVRRPKAFVSIDDIAL